MGRSPFRRTKRRPQSGQSLAEFAIIFPVLFLIIAGIVQFGIIFWGQNSLNQVVRDTGRWAASQQTQCTTPPEQASAAADVIDTANDVANASSLIGYTSADPWDTADVTVT